MNNQNVLALDLATRTGWALKTREGIVRYGSHLISASSGLKKAQKWINYRHWLSGMIQKHDIHVIVYEDVKRHVSNLSARSYCGLLAITEMMALSYNIEMIGFGVGTVKKHWTGNGKASKEEMMQVAKEKGFDTAYDDEADALAILHLCLRLDRNH